MVKFLLLTGEVTHSFRVNPKLKNMKCGIRELQTKLYCIVQNADRQTDRNAFSNATLKTPLYAC